MTKRFIYEKVSALVLAFLLCFSACSSTPSESDVSSGSKASADLSSAASSNSSLSDVVSASPDSSEASAETGDMASVPASSRKPLKPANNTSSQAAHPSPSVRPSGTESTGSNDIFADIPIPPIPDNLYYTDFYEEMSVQEAIYNFSVRLLRNSESGSQNALVSPVSILSAMAMAFNGAGGNTLSQFENAAQTDIGSLNSLFGDFISDLPDGNKCKLHIANGIWLNDNNSFKISESFLNTNNTHYKAEIRKTPFNRNTVGEINQFVNKNTNGMIKKLVDDIDEQTLAYLVNALAFEAEWENVYETNDIHNGTFTTDSGAQRKVEFMSSNEKYYINHYNFTGVLKPYKGGRYAFAAILPNEEAKLSALIDYGLGQALATALESATEATVITSIPKFEIEYDSSMTEALQAMGITDAFDAKAADFSGIGSYENQNFFIGDVIHKTKITVDELGTKAGAATGYPVAGASPYWKYISFDRPFVYMIVDLKYNIPVFIGAVDDIGA